MRGLQDKVKVVPESASYNAQYNIQEGTVLTDCWTSNSWPGRTSAKEKKIAPVEPSTKSNPSTSTLPSPSELTLASHDRPSASRSCRLTASSSNSSDFVRLSRVGGLAGWPAWGRGRSSSARSDVDDDGAESMLEDMVTVENGRSGPIDSTVNEAVR